VKTPLPVAKTPVPVIKPVVKITPRPFIKPLPSASTRIVTSKIPKKIIKRPVPTPTPTARALATQSDGWKSIDVISVTREKRIKIIPIDTMDLEEVDDYAGSNREFVIIECKIKYNKDIIIKSNSPQIAIVDQNDRIYYLYAMSTFKFKYGGNKASKKMEALQAANYYELSLKDSRPTITFVFKVENNNQLKDLKIQGYKNLLLTSFNS
jgi:hypothetical protein